MNRPYFTPNDFKKYNQALTKTVAILEKEYNKIARRKNGLISNQDIEKAFTKTKQQTNALSHAEKQAQEALFDTFSGALMMFGNSGQAFEQLKQMLNKS